MALEDIEKLKERVDKDPNSKLFVPLAEEYRKEGMTDDAINVLLIGIERQPGYMSARVCLGKIYLEKGMMKEAQDEFEKVVRSIPDNLFAHKKLADIYRGTGNRDLAVKEYRMVLKLNAMDEEALNSLNDLEQGAFASPRDEAGISAPLDEEAPAEPMLGDESLFEESEDKAASPGTGPSDFLSEKTPAEAGLHEDELSSFKDSLFGGKAGADEELHEGTVLKADGPMQIKEKPFEVADDEEISFDDINESLHSPGPVTVGGPATGTEEIFSKAMVREEEKFDMAPMEKPIGKAGLEDANNLVSEGNYTGAMNIYRRILLTDPNDKKVLQRIEELKSLLKFMGKDKEALIERLDSFMDGIKKRQDEFHRSP